jgi:hypothetical protein
VPPRPRQRHPPRPAPPEEHLRPEDQLLPRLAAVAVLLASDGNPEGASTAQVTIPAEAADLIDQLRASHVILTYDPDTGILRTSDSDPVAVTVGQDY